MTLSGDGDPRERRRRAQEYRRDVDVRRPWLLWLLVGLAIAVLGGVVVVAIVTGMGA